MFISQYRVACQHCWEPLPGVPAVDAEHWFVPCFGSGDLVPYAVARDCDLGDRGVGLRRLRLAPFVDYLGGIASARWVLFATLP
jgi:hypothetical protein